MAYPRLRWQIESADLVCPYGVNFVDFAFLARTWATESGKPQWNPACDISVPPDGTINALDLEVLLRNWLARK